LKSADSNFEFWRDLRKEFSSLQTLSRELRADRSLPITGDVPPPSAIWTIFCSDRILQQRWETLAKRGGDALSPNDFVDAVRVWLEKLRAEKINATEQEYFIDSQNIGGQYIHESIKDLAGASAILCGLLESTALDRERNVRAIKARGDFFQQSVEWLPDPATKREGTPASPVPPALPEAALPAAPPLLANERRKVVEPLLDAKGWSVLDWANEAGVAHATAMDYLDLKTRPYPSTRLKLANALGISQDQLPL
jgi:hypothetical protein